MMIKMWIRAMVSKLQWWNKLHGCNGLLILLLMVPSVCFLLLCRFFYNRWSDRRELVTKLVSSKTISAFQLTMALLATSSRLTPMPSSFLPLCTPNAGRANGLGWPWKEANQSIQVISSKPTTTNFCRCRLQSPQWCYSCMNNQHKEHLQGYPLIGGDYCCFLFIS